MQPGHRALYCVQKVNEVSHGVKPCYLPHRASVLLHLVKAWGLAINSIPCNVAWFTVYQDLTLEFQHFTMYGTNGCTNCLPWSSRHILQGACRHVRPSLLLPRAAVRPSCCHVELDHITEEQDHHGSV